MPNRIKESTEGQNQLYTTDLELFKMLKFIQKDHFIDPQSGYLASDIIETFKSLCMRVKCFDVQTNTYNLNHSTLLQKIFKLDQPVTHNNIWSVLSKKCVAL